MQFKKMLTFIVQSITIGLAAAFVILLLRSHLSVDQPTIAMGAGAKPSDTFFRAIGAPPISKHEVASYADAVEAAIPAVVNIHTAKILPQRTNPLFEDPLFRHFFGDAQMLPSKRLETSLGSGVIIDNEGYILTNVHVIEGADEIKVTLNDGRQAEAIIVGTDPESDLAVLQIGLDDLPSIAFGNSDALRVGDVVLAIGNPYGYAQTVTQGIVSATGRDQLGINTFEDFIQTDAAINPGNSGGALVNVQGELIGINTVIYSKTGASHGISFAIPMSIAKEVMDEIIQFGRVVRGWLGLVARRVPPELATSPGSFESGVLVAAVLTNGPADQAGIEPGDIVTHIRGQPVTDAGQAIRTIAKIEPGTEITVTVRRGEDQLTLRPTVVQRPPVSPR
ncbi:MAG: trypsin-like peptidase domain-containing protein [Gammaproteobacteria bacterium]|nr:trypsin-like peptidase domain-containing protein [Gammaproteobacteria bacterium]